MAAVDVGMRDNPPINDDLDVLFNYNVDEDIYQDVDINMDLAPKSGQSLNKGNDVLKDGLGLEQEIKVRKARQPIAKLDEKRLLSQAGIPKLRKLTKERLRFKGKGHEYSDVARLLNLYQLWLDDLYPRAKFADGLAMIEKLGHSKRMQTMRKEWIREGRAKEVTRVEDVEQVSQGQNERQRSVARKDQREDADHGVATPGSQQTNSAGPSETEVISQQIARRHSGNGDGIDEGLFLSDDGEDMDDLDAIMAEDDAARKTASTVQSNGEKATSSARDTFADEEEAMREMDDYW